MSQSLAVAVAVVVVVVGSLVACTEGSSPDTPSERTGPIEWQTAGTLFRAASIAIEASGQEFRVATEHVELGPGAVVERRTTLEATWREHGVEMRLSMYLTTDGTDWWADEIRTYDGAAQGDWITHHGDFLRSPIDLPYEGDLVVGNLRLQGVFMKSFLEPTCDGSAYTLEPLAPVVKLVDLPDTGYGLPLRVRDGSCAEVTPPAGATFAWTVLDSAVARIASAPHDRFPAFAELAAVSPGATMGRVVMRDALGAELATRTFPVTVAPAP